MPHCPTKTKQEANHQNQICGLRKTPTKPHCSHTHNENTMTGAIRIINSKGYRDHTNPLFIKFMDLVYFKTAVITYIAKKIHCQEIYKKCLWKESKSNLRGD